MTIGAELPDRSKVNSVLQGARVARAEVIRELLLRFGRGMLRAFSPVGRAIQRSRLRSELTGLTDVQLKDIGLTRSDIDGIVAGTYEPPQPRGARPLEVTSTPKPPRPPRVIERDKDLRLAA